jgi:RecA-family ATPase
MVSIATPDPDKVNRELEEAARAELDGGYQYEPELSDIDPALAAATEAAISGKSLEEATKLLNALDNAKRAQTREQSRVWVPKQQRAANANVNGNNGHDLPQNGAITAESLGIVSTRVSDIEPEAILWLWDQRLACGKFSVISGNPGLGKSQVCASLSAVVSVGGKWPVTRDSAPLGSVIILSAEDDPKDTIRPRLEAAGADLTKIHLIEAVRATAQDGSIVRRGFSLSSDIPKLIVLMHELGDVRLVIIDPISAYFGATDSHKNAEVRTLLLPLQQAAQEMGAAILGISHLTKSEGMDVLLRTQGSVGIVAAARAVFGVGKDKEDPAKRYFMPLKNNLATDMNGFSYHIEEYCLPGTDPLIRTSRVLWDNELVTKNAEDVFTTPDREERSAVEEAEDFLRDALRMGWVKTVELQAQARKAGISWITVKRAQNKLQIKPTRHGGLGAGGGWGWELPDTSESE